MKILTYNIHHWQNPHGALNHQQIADVLLASQADIIALNEVTHPAPTPDSDLPVLETLARRLNMQFVFGQAQPFSRAFVRPSSAAGNAILSRWPILASAAHHLHTLPVVPTAGLLEARIQLPTGSPLTCYVTHLHPRDETVRLAQAKALLTWTMRDRNRPHLLMGDLNTYNPADYSSPSVLRQQLAEDDWVYYDAQTLSHLLKNGYIDAFAAAGVGPAPTYPAPQARYRIDYIMPSPMLAGQLRSCYRLDSPPAPAASDHFPLLAEFDN